MGVYPQGLHALLHLLVFSPMHNCTWLCLHSLVFSPGYRRHSSTVWPASWTFPSRLSLLSNRRTWCSPRRQSRSPLHRHRCHRGSCSPPHWSSSSQYFAIFSLSIKIFFIPVLSALSSHFFYIFNKCNQRELSMEILLLHCGIWKVNKLKKILAFHATAMTDGVF